MLCGTIKMQHGKKTGSKVHQGDLVKWVYQAKPFKYQDWIGLCLNVTDSRLKVLWVNNKTISLFVATHPRYCHEKLNVTST